MHIYLSSIYMCALFTNEKLSPCYEALILDDSLPSTFQESSSTKLGLVLLMWFTGTFEIFMIYQKKRVQVMFMMIMCKPCMRDPSLVKDMEPKGPRYVLLVSSIYVLHLGPLHASMCMFCIK